MILEIIWKYRKIPRGMYCHFKDRVCPYWSILEALPERENGYCSLLDKSDWDINEDIKTVEVTILDDGKGIYRTIESTHIFRLSLLWDKCKECGIKEYDWWMFGPDIKMFLCKCIEIIWNWYQWFLQRISRR